MNIGFFYKHYDADGGFPRDWHAFATALSDLGEEVTVYTYEGLVPKHHPSIEIKRFAGKRRSSFALPRALADALSEDAARLDILEIVGAYFPENFSVARLASRAGLPYVVSPLGHLAPKIVRRHALKKRAFIRGFLQPVMRRAHGIHVFSEQEAQSIRTYADRPVIRTRLGAFFEDVPDRLDETYLRKTLGLSDDSPVLLYLGRLDAAGKGLTTLIDAFRQVRDRLPAARLVLVGPDNGHDRASLEAQIRASGLADRVIVREPLFGPEKYSAFASADLFVYPSNYDVIPRSIREALSVGCPVLASEESHVGPILRDHGAGVAVPVDACAIANAIVRLVGDRAGLRAMRPKARRAAEQALDWHHEAATLRDGYRLLLQAA